MRDKVRKFLARHRRNKLVRKVGRGLGYFADGFDNQDYDIETNGEQFVIQSLALVNPQATVFDVGAHEGDWARMAARALPKGKIHSFEVIPATYLQLRRNCADLPLVSPYNQGLGESDGTLDFSVATDRNDLSSGVKGVHGDLHKFDFSVVQCPIATGDGFCAKHAIQRIDLLKIDVEGMEPAVIRGFGGMLEQGRVGAVQFEYGQINLQARFFLGDFYALLGRYKMKIGKIYPTYVDFCEYSFSQDTLRGPNYLAVHAENRELLRRLRG